MLFVLLLVVVVVVVVVGAVVGAVGAVVAVVVVDSTSCVGALILGLGPGLGLSFGTQSLLAYRILQYCVIYQNKLVIRVLCSKTL